MGACASAPFKGKSVPANHRSQPAARNDVHQSRDVSAAQAAHQLGSGSAGSGEAVAVHTQQDPLQPRLSAEWHPRQVEHISTGSSTKASRDPGPQPSGHEQQQAGALESAGVRPSSKVSTMSSHSSAQPSSCPAAELDHKVRLNHGPLTPQARGPSEPSPVAGGLATFCGQM